MLNSLRSTCHSCYNYCKETAAHITPWVQTGALVVGGVAGLALMGWAYYGNAAATMRSSGWEDPVIRDTFALGQSCLTVCGAALQRYVSETPWLSVVAAHVGARALLGDPTMTVTAKYDKQFLIPYDQFISTSTLTSHLLECTDTAYVCETLYGPACRQSEALSVEVQACMQACEPVHDYRVLENDLQTEMLSRNFSANRFKKRVLWLRTLSDRNGGLRLSPTPFLQSLTHIFDVKLMPVTSLEEICQAIQLYGAGLAGLILHAHGGSDYLMIGEKDRGDGVFSRHLSPACFSALSRETSIFLMACLTASSEGAGRYAVSERNFASRLHEIAERTVIGSRVACSFHDLRLEGPAFTDIRIVHKGERVDVLYQKIQFLYNASISWAV